MPVTIVEWACDTGAVQHDSLVLDIPETLAAASRFVAEGPRHLEELRARFRADETRVVVCDVPALPCAAARRAGIPAVALSNFTWDWIYEDFTTDHPGHDDLPSRLRQWYAEAEAGWQLPMGGGFAGFSTVLDMPWVARRSQRDPDDTRRLLGGDSRPLVLLSFGGYGVADWQLRHHAGAPYRLAIAGGASHDPSTLPDDALQVPHDRLKALGLRYEDLVAACDVVVSKPGYGIVSECVANRTALLYTSRGRFREYDVMVAEMPQVLRVRHLPQSALASLRWDDDIAALLAQPAPATRPLVNGADVAAGMISAML